MSRAEFSDGLLAAIARPFGTPVPASVRYGGQVWVVFEYERGDVKVEPARRARDV